MNKQTIEAQLTMHGVIRNQHYYFGMYTEQDGTSKPCIYFRGKNSRGRQACVLPIDDAEDAIFADALAPKIIKSTKGTLWEIPDKKPDNSASAWVKLFKKRKK